jgi:HEAT repeat protein
MGFEWPERLSRLEREMRHAKPLRRQEIVRMFAAYPASEVVDVLLNALEDDHRMVRLEAAQVAGRIGLRKVIPLLLEWVADSDIDERVQAVTTLGKLADPKALPILVALLDDNETEVRKAAAIALGHFDGAESIEALIPRLDDPEPIVRAQVIKTLGRLGDKRAVDPILLRVSKESDELKVLALNALGRLGDDRAIQPLVEALNDKDEETQIAAAMALGALNSEAAIDALRDRLAECSARTGKAIIAALGKIGDTRVLPFIVNALGDRKLGQTASDVLVARARKSVLDANRETEPIVIALGEKLESVPGRDGYAMIAQTLVEISTFTSIKVIAPTLIAKRDASREALQRFRLRILAASGAKEAATPLLQGLENARPSDLSLLIDSLLDYFSRAPADGRFVKPLIALLDRVNNAQRVPIIRLIGTVGSSEELPKLRQLIKHKNREIRIAVVKAMSAIGDSACVPYLIALLQVRDTKLQSEVERALGRVADAQTLIDLIDRLDATELKRNRKLVVALGEALAHSRESDRLSEHTVRRAVALLSRLVAGPDLKLSAYAVDASVRWGDPRVIQSVGKLFLRPSVFQRVNSLSALGSFKTAEVKNVLRHLIRTARAQVLVAAAASIGESADRRDIDQLIALNKRAHWPVQAAAAYSIARYVRRSGLRRHSLQRKLCSMGRSTDPYLRANVAAAMAAMRASPCPDSGPNPVRWLGREHPEVVRSSAARWAYAAAQANKLPKNEVNRLLYECSRSEPDPFVAQACQTPELPALDSEIDRYAHTADGRKILKNKLVGLQLADGTVYIGYTDINGHVRIRNAPRGDFQLVDPGLIPIPR